MKNYNPYLQQINSVLPRLLALFDSDQTNQTYGQGDRYFWAWKLKDFGNGTYQGAAHGLARLVVNDLLPQEVSNDSILRRIDSMFLGAERLRDKNGSMSEAFPYESSFCVTALVTFDLLSAIELLRTRIDEKQRVKYLGIVKPMIDFLRKTDEKHAFISNHLATAAAALYKWSFLTDDKDIVRAEVLIKRILDSQSTEGWFKEYEGADPGYQSLATYYLADVHRMHPDLGLLAPLRRSVQFLWYFAHPDGSFGGSYGSRNTRFYCPAGIEFLSNSIPEANVLAVFLRNSIVNHATVTLDALDESNLVPFFNAYCWAAEIYNNGKSKENASSLLSLPCIDNVSWCREFRQAGIIIDKGLAHYTIVSWYKGGVCYHFNRSLNVVSINPGVLAIAKNKKYYSTQIYQLSNQICIEKNKVIIVAPLSALDKRLPGSFSFLLLRLACVTVMRNLFLSNLVKKALVKFLITGKRASVVCNCRTINFGPDIKIIDKWQGNDGGFERVEARPSFCAIHMASQGYWQKQDDTE